MPGQHRRDPRLPLVKTKPPLHQKSSKQVNNVPEISQNDKASGKEKMGYKGNKPIQITEPVKENTLQQTEGSPTSNKETLQRLSKKEDKQEECTKYGMKTGNRFETLPAETAC